MLLLSISAAMRRDAVRGEAAHAVAQHVGGLAETVIEHGSVVGEHIESG